MRHPEAERLHKSLVKNGFESVAKGIASGVPLPLSPTLEEKENWIRFTTHQLETRFDADTVKRIRKDCHCNLSVDDLMVTYKGFYNDAENLDAFVAMIQQHSQDAAYTTYTEHGKLYAVYEKCPCPFLEESDMRLTSTWCYCTLGYNENFWSFIFGKKVTANLLESIKRGDSRCLIELIL